MKTFTGDLKGNFNTLQGINEETKNWLLNEKLLFKEGDKFKTAGNLYMDWPSARGIFYNEDKNFFVWVNEED